MNQGSTFSVARVKQDLQQLRNEVAGALGRTHEAMHTLGSANAAFAGILPQYMAADDDMTQRLAALDAAIAYLDSPADKDMATLRELLVPLLSATPQPHDARRTVRH